MSRDFSLAVSDLIERIRAASAHGSPLCIRGGGSKDFLGGALRGELLDTRALAGILSYEPSELVVSVGAGTPLAELEAALAERGQCLPFEPPQFAPGTTVGGMVAAGLAGPARASVGSVRDHVLGASLLNGRAEHLHLGGTVIKNVAGYDISRLLAGSMGVLGVITQLHLKVMPRASAEATLRFDCSQSEALHRLNRWGGQALPLNASRWSAQGGGASLWLRLRGAVAAVEAACTRLQHEAGGERVPNTPAAAEWQACRDQRLPWFKQRLGDHALWRLSVPQNAPALALPGEPLVEWHGGLRWLQAPADAQTVLRKMAREVGGHATIFIAQDVQGTSATVQIDSKSAALPPVLADLHAALKREFDPAGLFNPGRLLPGF